MVCMWKIKQDKVPDFQLLESMRGHTGHITSLATSRSYSVIVSGSQDKTVIIWDLNRREYVRNLTGHETAVDIVRVNDTTVGPLSNPSAARIDLTHI